LETAFGREKTLTADLAHELRTPLHGLRLTLEVALTRPREADHYRRTLEECQAMVVATQTMAQDLLTLARLDADRDAVNPEPARLLPLLRACWEPLAQRAQARRLTVEWGSGDAWVSTHPERLRLVLSNLLGNAVDHADEGGRIRITVTDGADQVALRLANTGSQVASADTDRVFDRFWRQDSARGGDDAHCGLGLSIVRRAADLLGIAIHAESEVGGWFEMALHLPKVRP
jgi:signal transduction histidine kinase